MKSVSIVGIFFILLTACTRKNEPSSVRISLPAKTTSSSAKANKVVSFAQANDGWGLSPFTEVASADCYLVMVEASDLPGAKCLDSTGTTVATPGPVIGFAPAGSSLVVDVPSGPARTIMIAGITLATGKTCLDFRSSGFLRKDVSPPTIVAKKTVDLLPGDVNVEMTASMTGSLAIQSCSGGEFGSEWSLAARVPVLADISLTNSSVQVASSVASGSTTPITAPLATASTKSFTFQDLPSRPPRAAAGARAHSAPPLIMAMAPTRSPSQARSPAQPPPSPPRSVHRP